MTSTTPILLFAVQPLKCWICGNPASFHISYSTFATFQMNHKFKCYRPVSTGLSQHHIACLWPSRRATSSGWDRYSPPVQNSEPSACTTLIKLVCSHPATIQHFLWQLWQPLLQIMPLDTLETRMQTAVCHVDLPFLFVYRDHASHTPKRESGQHRHAWCLTYPSGGAPMHRAYVPW